MPKLLMIALFLTGVIAEARGETTTSLRLVLPARPEPVVEHIGRVFERQVESRCGAKVETQGEAPLTVELAIEPGIGDEGFKIADGTKGTIRIIGNDTRGALYGVGKFLHTSAYTAEGFVPSTWRGVSVPKMPQRMMYLATHFQNYYQVAPIKEVERYVEDLSLWGVNNLVVWFGMEEFNGISDPKAQAMLARLRALLKTAKDLGLGTGIGGVGNDGYRNTPSELRATMVAFNQGVELCPNKPGVVELELQFCQEKFDAFKSVGLDYWFIVPYDNGGCGCEKCIPWGINGFLKVAEPEARAFRRAFPNGKVVMSTWYFDHPQLYSGEWAGLTAKFKAQKPDWVDCIMADNFEAYPRYPLEKGVPGGLPLLNFPDISMWGQNPWGGYGANPHPGRLQQRWDETQKHLAGGMPYSEGIYEDLNKVICAQFYWEPDRPAMETVKEYAAFEFSPEVADDVASVVTLFEKNHKRDQIGESAVTACQLVDRADAKLTPQARSAWRWRLFCIRAAIDQEIYRNSLGQGRDEVFRQACEELTKISHAENVWSVLRPVPIPAVNVEGPGLPAGYAEAIAASKPVAWWRMDQFHERQVEDATEHKHGAVFEDGVTLVAPGHAATTADKQPSNRAGCFTGGRMKATMEKLSDAYSVEFWFCNTMPNTARPVTGYVFSRGVEGPEGTPGDDLGISGTSAVDIIKPGRLFFYNGDAAEQAFGQTELALGSWNHVVLVRDGRRILVYLNGNPVPEISGEMKRGYPDGATQVFIGGRNDNFGNLQGKIAEVAVYDRALNSAEAAGHYRAAAYRIWPSQPPADCPFPPSTDITGIAFTGRYAHYNDDNKDLPRMIGDTWYPSWAEDGKLYSPWTDGFLNGVKSASWAGEKATTGHATILGDDPLHLTFADAGVYPGSAVPYSGRYPCANLVYNGVWYYGTYCLNDSDGDPCAGLNWDILGPFVGFRYSTDYGTTWTDTPHTPARPLFGEPAKAGGPLKLGVPHVVDFGKNMQYSPDGKAYLVGHGATQPDPKPRAANLSWVTGDQIYMARVLPSPANMNDVTQYEFFAGHDAQGNPIWTHDFSKLKPLVDWNDNCGGATITYNPGLKKYLMCVNDGGDTISKMNTYILESDRITGPWKLVVYMRHFGEQAYFANIPSKFISADGRTAWLCYSVNFTNVALPKLPKLKYDPPAGHPVGDASPMVWQEFQLLPLVDVADRVQARQE